MQHFNFINVSFFCLFTIILVLWPGKIKAEITDDPKKIMIKHPCEVAIVLDESRSVSDEDLARIVGAAKNFSNFFAMSEEHTRVGVVAFSGRSHVILNLTSDPNLLQSIVVPRQTDNLYTNTDLALGDVRDTIFKDARANVKKMVVLITDGTTRTIVKTEDIAKELRADGYLIYIVAFGDDYKKDEVAAHLASVSGDPSRVIKGIDLTNVNPGDIFGGVGGIGGLFSCEFEPGCSFSSPDRSECVATWWRPILKSKLECMNAYPPESPKKNCLPTECDEMCNKWPWERPVCSEADIGKKPMLKRGPKPEFNAYMFQNCPITKPSDSTCSATSTPQAGAEDQQKANEGGGGLEWWIILICVIVGCLFMALIAFGVVLTMQKRKKKAMEEEKAKKAAMEKSLVKSVAASPILKVEAPAGKGAEVDFGFERKLGAQQSVEANLLEKSGVSKMGKSMKKSTLMKKNASMKGK